MPFFSVITICFNDFENLKRTACSVREQQFQDFEWLVIDGGSKDGTRAWLEAQGATGLQWVSEPDRGLYDAMNKGIDRAQGGYLIFMNSGDCFDGDQVLSRVHAALVATQEQALLAYGDSVDVEPHGVTHPRAARHHARAGAGMFAQHQAMFFKRLPGVRYRMEYRLSADYAFIGEYLRLAATAGGQGVLRLNFAVCQFLLGGLNEQRRFAALKEDFHIRRQIFGQSLVQASALYGAHLVHTWLKRLSPALAGVFKRA